MHTSISCTPALTEPAGRDIEAAVNTDAHTSDETVLSITTNLSHWRHML
jgi:hypothetical protein